MPAVDPARLHRPSDNRDIDDFAKSVLSGLSQRQKSIPSRYFYDQRGSILFEEITRLPEYYPTATEIVILEQHIGDMMHGVADNAVIVEFGSGSSRKTEILLKQIGERVAYVPIDVSATALRKAVARLRDRFPTLEIHPVVSDFTSVFSLPQHLRHRPIVGFFPGSTIGNFTPPEASHLLAAFRSHLGGHSRLLVGVDLKKSLDILLPAYNDAAGITAQFNLNLLARINRELDGTFDLTAFSHRAIYNAGQGRIEMHLVSQRRQQVEVSGHIFTFERGEYIHTENSYKYTVADFRRLARAAGWRPQNVWQDSRALFSVHALFGADPV